MKFQVSNFHCLCFSNQDNLLDKHNAEGTFGDQEQDTSRRMKPLVVRLTVSLMGRASTPTFPCARLCVCIHVLQQTNHTLVGRNTRRKQTTITWFGQNAKVHCSYQIYKQYNNRNTLSAHHTFIDECVYPYI